MKVEIQRTKNYKMFNKMLGNRDVSQIRVNKIIKSIREVGYVCSPIIVNEKMEVIDGQGRLEALRQLKMPVDYIVQEGIGMQECVAMNIYQTRWTNRDYIKSYAERGDESYILLQKLLEEFPMIGINVIATALFKTGKISSVSIAKGTLIITEEMYDSARMKLIELVTLLPSCNKVVGCLEFLLQSILYASEMKDVDKERLFNKVSMYAQVMTPFRNLNECMQSLEDLYNQSAKKPVYFYTEFRILMRENLKINARDRKELKYAQIKKANEEVELQNVDEFMKALEEIESE